MARKLLLLRRGQAALQLPFMPPHLKAYHILAPRRLRHGFQKVLIRFAMMKMQAAVSRGGFQREVQRW